MNLNKSVSQQLEIVNNSISKYEKSIAYATLGKLYTQSKNHKKAIESYKKSIIANPNNSDGYIELGNALRDINKMDEALAVFKQNLKNHPESLITHQAIGKLYRDIKNYSKAINWFEKAVMLDTTNAYSYSMLGILKQQVGEFSDALKLQQEAVKLEPNNGMYLMTLGSIYRKLKTDDLAVKSFKAAKEKISLDDYYNRACLEALLGNISSAIDLLEAAIAERPYRKEWAKSDPDLDSIKGTSEFLKLVK